MMMMCVCVSVCLYLEEEQMGDCGFLERAEKEMTRVWMSAKMCEGE
jgi:hypothetical protein